MRSISTMAALLALVAGSAAARATEDEAATAQQPAAVQEPPQSQKVVPGPQFKRGGFYRMLFGDNYRDLWTAPVEVPVLDMKAFAGGIKATRRLGHGQTKALALAGADGSAWTFRPILKDPVGLLPPELHGTLAARFVRDQMSSQHPAGHVVVPGLIDALGLLHNTPRLVLMPDDPALGEFRDDFKDIVGDLEEFTGQKGFGGSTEIIDGEEMWKRLDASPATRVDSRAYLTARLLDHMIGDWDRHRDQWRWAKLPGKDLWQPIPEDRDQAFARFGGFAIGILRPGLPLLVHFENEYSSLHGLTFDSWDVDRRLLADLERPVWEEVAKEVQARITDAVIEDAVRRMPKEWFEQVGPSTITALKKRRDGLPGHAMKFYRFFAPQVDVRATNEDDSVQVERLQGGDVEVRVAAAATPEAPYFRRRFVKGETKDVRVYLFSGNDRVLSSGPKGGITVRVIGGNGEDVVDDSAAGGLRVSDAEGQTHLKKGPGTSLDAKPYEAPPPGVRGDWIPARDWGRRTLFPIFRIGGNTDYGVVMAASLKTTGYGFRKHPWANDQLFRVAFATKEAAFRGDYEGRFRFENSRMMAVFKAKASGFDLVRFYGFGNETQSPFPDNFYRVNQDLFTFEPGLSFELGKRWTASFGGIAKHVKTELDPDNPLSQIRPLGTQSTTQLGGFASLTADTTDRPGLPTKGVRIWAGGSAYPAVAGLENSFGEVHLEAAAYVTAGATLALRAGGKSVFGDYPFYEAAFLGGAPSLRGLRLQRYAGDHMLHGGAELYIPLVKAFLFVPGQIGIMGLADVGRVYLEGESSKKWHQGYGGGLFFTSPNRNNIVAFSVAQSEGRTGFYIKIGLAVSPP